MSSNLLFERFQKIGNSIDIICIMLIISILYNYTILYNFFFIFYSIFINLFIEYKYFISKNSRKI